MFHGPHQNPFERSATRKFLYKPLFESFKTNFTDLPSLFKETYFFNCNFWYYLEEFVLSSKNLGGGGGTCLASLP